MMPTWLRHTAGGLPGDFWYLWAGTLITRLGNLTILYLSISLVARYHFSPSFAGLTLGVAGAGSAVGAVLGGVLSDRFGHRNMLLASNLCLAALTFALAFPTRAAPIATLASLYGMAMGATRAPSSAMILDALAPDQRPGGLNLNYWAMNIGFAGASSLAGALAGQPRIWIFGIDAISSAAAGLLVYARVRPPERPTVAKRQTAEGRLRSVFTDRTFMVFVLLGVGFWTVISCCALMPITMTHRALPPAAFGGILAVNGLLIVAGQLFVPQLLRRRSRNAALVMSSSLVAIGMGAVAIAASVPALAATVVVWTIGEMLSVPGTASLTAELSPAHMRGRYQGVYSITATLSGFLAPVIGGFSIEHAGDVVTWTGTFVLGVAVAIGYLLSGPARERQAAAMRASETAHVPPPREPAPALVLQE